MVEVVPLRRKAPWKERFALGGLPARGTGVVRLLGRCFGGIYGASVTGGGLLKHGTGGTFSQITEPLNSTSGNPAQGASPSRRVEPTVCR
jgi:hypothetical protein